MIEIAPRIKRFVIPVGLPTLLLSACGQAETNPEAPEPCNPFIVYAQNRFPAGDGGYGAAVWAQPDINSEKVGSYAGNTIIKAIGYVVTTQKAYPYNPPEIDGDHWVVVETSDGHEGYISDAGIRADKTRPDPSGGYSDNLGRTFDFSSLPEACDVSK